MGRQHAAVAGEPPVRRDRGGSHRARTAGGRRGVPHHARARQGGDRKPVDAARRRPCAPLGRRAARHERPRVATRAARGLRHVRALRERVPRRPRPVDRRTTRRARRLRRALRRHRGRQRARVVPRRQERRDPRHRGTGQPHGRVPLSQVPERHHGGESGRRRPAGERGRGAAARDCEHPLGVAVVGDRRDRALVPDGTGRLSRAAGAATRGRRATGDRPTAVGDDPPPRSVRLLPHRAAPHRRDARPRSRDHAAPHRHRRPALVRRTGQQLHHPRRSPA